MKEILREGPYKELQASASAKDGCFYTHHGMSHVEEVIEYAGYLVGLKEKSDFNFARKILRPYEAYILLVSILLHDAGMIGGREDHEARAKEIILSLGSASGEDNIEKTRIATIAKAHSGKKDGIETDAIGDMNLGEEVQYLGCSYRPRMIAALVRFADEICETKKRAASYSLNTGKIPRGNEVYHVYANSISSSMPDLGSKSLRIKFEVLDKYLFSKLGKGSQDVFLIDEIRKRLEKINRERMYCNRYLPLQSRIEKIVADLHIIDENYEYRGNHSYIVEDRGYPPESVAIVDVYPEFTSDQFQAKYTRT